MRLRSVLARILLLGVAVCSGSCLVVSDPDFRGQEDCIPFFVTQQAEPALASTERIPATPTDPLEFRGSVPMRSCALTKIYQIRVFLDNELQPESTIPPTGDEERPVSVLVDLSRTKPGCHQVEVLVSSSFTLDARTAAKPDDLAYLVWWFTNTSGAQFQDCNHTVTP
jgi:hypothetical protein